jgi:exodeoxyribonuclease VII small subunit
MGDQTLTFESAFNELKEIEQALEQHSLPLEELTKKVERANYLLTFCKNSLRKVETSLDQLFEEE